MPADREHNEEIGHILSVYGPHIRRRIRTRIRLMGLQSKVESVDVCQSVLAHLVRRERLDAVLQAESPMNYLAKSMENKIVEILRRFRSKGRDVTRENAQPLENEIGPGGGSSPSSIIARQELYDVMLDTLGEQERRICEMRSQGLAFNEIGERLSISSDAVRMSYNRALKKLKERFGSQQ